MTHQTPRPLVVALGILLCPLIAASQVMTESEALRRFEAENPVIRAFEARVRAVQADVRSWGRWINPSVTYSQEDAAGTRDEFVLLQQSLPLNGRLGLLRKAGRAEAGSAAAETTYAKLQLRSDFRAAFFGLLAAQERLASLESGLAPLREIARVLGERERAGEGSTFDSIRAERELAEREATLEQARVLLVEARSRLGAFLASGSDPLSLEASGTFASAKALPALDDLIARALAARGDYLAGQRRVERFGYEKRAAMRIIIPEPVVSGGLKRTAVPGFDDNGFAVSITVPLPLFDGGGPQIARAKAAQEQSEAAAAALGRGVETGVRAAYEALRSYRRIAEDYARKLGDSGARLSEISRLSYEEGEQGILELLDSHRVALNSRLMALELNLAAKLAEIELNRAVGEEIF